MTRSLLPVLAMLVVATCGPAQAQGVGGADEDSPTNPQRADPGGYFRLQSMYLENENKCLEGNRFEANSTLRGASFMDDCQNVSGQLWKAVEDQNGYFRLQTQFLENENKCLEGNRVAPGSTLGGAAFMDDCQNVSGQLWKMLPADNGYFRLTTMFLEGEGKCLESNRPAPGAYLGGGAFMDNCQNVSGQLWKKAAP